MASLTSTAEPVSPRAPIFMVQDRVAMTVEHPCMVKNVDKAVEMIGGPSAVARCLIAEPKSPLHLRFQPDDPISRPVSSIPRTANNILLQVTVTKRTGRKRKRGSSGPFIDDVKYQAPTQDSRYLLQSLRHNPSSYFVEAIATISSTHVWRSMPDFAYSAVHSDFLNDIREKLLSKSYPLMKQYRMPQTYGLTNTEVVPPPRLSAQTIPTNYSYRANALISPHTDAITGQQSLYHGKESRKRHTISVQWYGNFPKKPPLSLPALSTQTPIYQSIVETLRTIFSKRPIWTGRALINQLPTNTGLQNARFALAHVAYTIRSGPWRDTLCVLGIDPRTDPKYRIYQSVMIQLVKKQGPADSLDNDSDEDTTWDASRSWKRSEDTTSHIFTGTGSVPPDGKIWQVCDIVDPQLASVINLDESVIERECEIRTRGYYPAGAWAKLKVALKYKIDALKKGRAEEYAATIDNFLDLPDVWDGVGTEADALPGQVTGGFLHSERKGPELHWSALWRSMVRSMLSGEKQAAMEGAKEKEKENDEPRPRWEGPTKEAGSAFAEESTPTGPRNPPGIVDIEAVDEYGGGSLAVEGEEAGRSRAGDQQNGQDDVWARLMSTNDE